MNCSVLAICLFLLTALVSTQPCCQASPPCLGCPEKVDTIPTNIVQFAASKLKSANNGLLKSCSMELVGPFTSQLVAGTVFRFDLKIGSSPGPGTTCPAAPETCHMAVFQPLSFEENQDLQVLVGAPENTHCTREPVKSNPYVIPGHIPGHLSFADFVTHFI